MVPQRDALAPTAQAQTTRRSTARLWQGDYSNDHSLQSTCSTGEGNLGSVSGGRREPSETNHATSGFAAEEAARS